MPPVDFEKAQDKFNPSLPDDNGNPISFCVFDKSSDSFKSSDCPSSPQGRLVQPENQADNHHYYALLPDLQITEPQKLNPRFNWLSTSEVREQTRSLWLTKEGFDKGQEAHIELINRADSTLRNFDIGAFKESAGVLLKALQQGKDVAAIDGKIEISDTPLSPERRLQFHVAINSDLNDLSEQVQTRLDYTAFLRAFEQHADAERVGVDAIKRADELPIDLIRQARMQLRDDIRFFDRDTREKLIEHMNSDEYAQMDTLPILARKTLALVYLRLNRDEMDCLLSAPR